MEPYILTEDDIARLSEQGFDMRGVSAGAEATRAEAAILSGGAPAQPTLPSSPPTMSTLPYVPGEDDSVMRTLPYDPSTAPSTVMPMSGTTPAPVTFTEADGSTSTAPSASAIPQSLPAAAAPGTTMVPTGSNTPLPDQPRGFSGILSGLTGMFGGQGNTAGSFNPAAGGGIAQSTDPFEGLSRNQRMMLGFAALRDAAASLEGRDSSFFTDQLGVYETARERERLRVQGAMQNRAQAMIGLMPVFQEIQRLQSLGQPVPDYLQRIVQETLAPYMGAGGPSGMPTPASGSMPMPTTTPTAPTAPTTTPTAPTTPATTPATQPTEAAPAPAPTEEQPLSPTGARLAEIQTQREELMRQMRDRLGARAPTDDLEEQLRLLGEEESTLREQATEEAAAAEAEAAAAEATAVQEETLMVPMLGDALSFFFTPDGEVNTQGVLAASILPLSGMGADARRAYGAIETLRGIQTLNSVAEARAQGYTGTFTDADIAIIQSVAGPLTFDNPEATADTLRRIAGKLSPQAQQALFGTSGIAPATFTPTEAQSSALERWK